MRLEFAEPYKSIIAPVTNQDIADFVVLSGPNGSGKSHLLEAIESGAIEVDGIKSLGRPSPGGRDFLRMPVRLFRLGELTVAPEHEKWQNQQVYKNTRMAISRDFQALSEEIKKRVSQDSDEFEQELVQRMLYGNLTLAALQQMLTATGKRLSEFTEHDFRKYAPALGGIHDPFTLTIGQLFMSYHTRRENNRYAQWRKEKSWPGGDAALTDDEFVARYGPPPWDLLNEIMDLIGLEYHLNNPEGIEEHLSYHALLTHRDTRTQIQTTDLSSGEKTLMAIAMSLYSGSHIGEAIQLPKVLLLDEPDASLHPSMARSLLRVVDDIFCKRHNVKVILVTHAPSTVALAPEESLYTMHRTGDPRIRLARSRDEALKELMVGLPTLSVRNEHRRQIFVESEHDEGCYQGLFRLLKDRLSTPFSLEFIASGRGGQGNDVAVKHLVQKLRIAGNEVQGIIDRDKRSGASEGIVFTASRRTLENLVLDPLPVGLLLLRESVVRSEDMVGESLRHFQVRAGHAQAICDYVVSKIRQDNDSEEKITVGYAGGFTATIPKFCLDIDGHTLEERFLEAFPALRKYRTALKAKVIELALADVPDFAPQDVLELFQRLSS